MARNQTGKGKNPIPAESSLAGILALLVEARESKPASDKTAEKTELLLSAAGLTVEEIVAVTRKKPDAVRKAIQRGRQK